MGTPFRFAASCVVADPPWKFGDSLPGNGRGAAKHYGVMPTRDICALRLPPIESDALLFLWRVGAMLQDALDVVKSWGFEAKSELTWVKLTKGVTKEEIRIPKGARGISIANHLPLHFGMGRYTRQSSETCIIAARGRAASLIQSHSVRSVFFAPVGEHSAKPDEFYQIVESLCPGPRVELFARRAREGWTTIGDQLGVRLELPLAPEAT